MHIFSPVDVIKENRSKPGCSQVTSFYDVQVLKKHRLRCVLFLTEPIEDDFFDALRLEGFFFFSVKIEAVGKSDIQRHFKSICHDEKSEVMYSTPR